MDMHKIEKVAKGMANMIGSAKNIQTDLGGLQEDVRRIESYLLAMLVIIYLLGSFVILSFVFRTMRHCAKNKYQRETDCNDKCPHDRRSFEPGFTVARKEEGRKKKASVAASAATNIPSLQSAGLQRPWAAKRAVPLNVILRRSKINGPVEKKKVGHVLQRRQTVVLQSAVNRQFREVSESVAGTVWTDVKLPWPTNLLSNTHMQPWARRSACRPWQSLESNRMRCRLRNGLAGDCSRHGPPYGAMKEAAWPEGKKGAPDATGCGAKRVPRRRRGRKWPLTVIQLRN
ncbi:unnamed protein product [Soboliphyme baturini]|uniref:Uncharacterized protein n=1 Tax=Soboliphyme baturini TaxID=241478 RepID=A0A183J2C3_9BILA|nr:unnamed protein product [Soboliphyme baturini]